MLEGAKANMIEQFTKDAATAYSKIITRYPVLDRASDAKARLQALHQPVPRPTKAAVAQNKEEEASRRQASMMSKVMRPFEKHPNVAGAAKVGEPTLVDPTPVSASTVVQEATRAALGTGTGGSGSVSVETVATGTPPPGQPAPRSDALPGNAAVAVPGPTGSVPSAAGSDANELKPNVPAEANELKPNVPDDSGQALPPPQQVNEIQAGASGQPASGQAASTGGQSASDANQPASDSDIAEASSKHKKKKGIHKVVPF
jgi:hypothetical protein